MCESECRIRCNVGGFTEGQRKYLEFHREAVSLEAKVRAWLELQMRAKPPHLQ